MLMPEFTKIFNECFPLLPVQIKTVNNQWYDGELKELHKIKNHYYKKYIASKTLLAKSKYNEMRNKYFRIIEKKKQNYDEQLLNNHRCSIKDTWKIINSMMGKTEKSNCSYLFINDKHIYDKEELANHFDKHFSTIAQNLLNKLPNPTTYYSDYLSKANREPIYLYATSPTEIKNIISGLKSKSSSGIDIIPSKLLKCFNENVLFTLSHIFNLSFKQGKFIECFKIAKLIPIHKSGTKNEINNFRPISLLSSLSKVLEKLVYNRVYAFFSKHNILFEAQFGFRKNSSTSHAATMLVEKITQAFECKKKALGVSLDLSKAFDTIDHKILLSKLYHCGIGGIAHEWFKSYSVNRLQYVECAKTLSSACSRVTHGVPQGSILGPLLFLVHVNDFKSCLNKSDAIMFADDTTILATNKSLSVLFDIVNKELTNVDN